jgi:Ala-tRNA(Pro) deacylase
MVTQDLVGELQKENIEYEVVPHEHTEHATDEAAALGISQEEVGKTLILKGSGGFVRAVLPASERLDLRSVRACLADREVRLATEQELASAYTGFELGAVPPFGGRAGDRVVVDRRIADLDRVVFEAGTHEESLRMRVADLVVLTHADVLDLCR